MGKVIKEITFDVLKSTEVDLKKTVTEKKRRRSKLDEYDYEDDFIEAFEGENEQVELECSLNNFFVFQGPLPYSTRKVINFFKTKPNFSTENDNEIKTFEESLYNVRRKRKASDTKLPPKTEIIEPDIILKKRTRPVKEYLYKDPIITYLYGKFIKFHERYKEIETNEKIWCVISNYILYKGNEELYEKNMKIYIKEKITRKFEGNDSKIKSQEDILKNNNLSNSHIQSSTIHLSTPPIDAHLYSCVSEFFTDQEIQIFVSNLIEKIDSACIKITVFVGEEKRYLLHPRKFLGFSELSFKTDCIIYFTNYVVKHYASDTRNDIMYYYQEAKKSITDAILECNNKVKLMYYINQHYKSLIDSNNYEN
ncbi:uncharacterized protein VNE69_11120 [Vairimorpha necatrix]|uniref:Uncharacterized protein n=1 Tax=Vairimorpha necatrix TaxID=6039 RepID=A0AAX4JGN1_9MICR